MSRLEVNVKVSSIQLEEPLGFVCHLIGDDDIEVRRKLMKIFTDMDGITATIILESKDE